MHKFGKSVGVGLAALWASTAPAQSVGDSTLFNARLGSDLVDFYNSVALDSADGLTDPLFTVTAGQSLLFGISLVGLRPDQVIATFAGVPVTLADPNVNGTVTFVPTTGGGFNYRERMTFDTVGSYSGTISVDALLTDPDYRFDGTSTRREAPTFTYRINVLAAGDVPEPATWGTMLLGFGLIGGMVRRRRPGGMVTA